jgi:hypothetical protein
VSERGADLSPCGRYRYRLWRKWSRDSSTCLFVMLNPSTADADTDDPTIRKCVGFAKRWRFGRVFVVNLFALRSTDPEGLLGQADPIGTSNDAFIRAEALCADRIVLAWGDCSPKIRTMVSARAFAVRRMLAPMQDKLVRIGVTKLGAPRHPLMRAYDSPVEAYA